MRKHLLFFSIISLLLFRASLLSHGVNYKKIEGGVGIEARYDNGEPISLAETKIFSPVSADETFQEGFTDINGRFIFYPDRSGNWKIFISDGMGHGVSTSIEVKDVKTMATGEAGNIPVPLYNKIITGISIILGITGILFFVATGKKQRR